MQSSMQTSFWAHESAAQKIYTPCGTAKENPFPGKRTLHLGCGNAKLPGAIGIDILSLPAVDLVHNLDSTPWPIQGESIDLFIAHSVLEHLRSLPAFFEEIWRTGKNGACVVITVPYFRSIDAFADPTHAHFFTSRSLDYFCDVSNSLSKYGYTPHKFKKLGFWYGWPQPSRNPIARWFKRFIHAYPLFYDQYLSVVLPVKILVWELEIRK